MEACKVIAIQPWFTAPGHPAQSTLNFARVIPAAHLAGVLIPETPRQSPFDLVARAIQMHAPLCRFRAVGQRWRLNTALSALAARRYRRRIAAKQSVYLFIDADLFVVGMMCAIAFFKEDSVCMVQLTGPESTLAHPVKQKTTIAALQSGRLKLLLRTPELTDAWRRAFPHFADRIQLLPTIESVVPPLPETQPRSDRAVHIGVIGQIRVGKAIPALLAAAESAIGQAVVTVHGPLYPHQAESFIRLMRRHPQVHIGFMPEENMLRAALQNDYISCLAEPDLWDTRMESASFWLAMKVARPVICFAEGWIGDMVRRTGCGVILARERLNEELHSLPPRTSERYHRLCSQIDTLRAASSPEALWKQLDAVLQKRTA